MKISRKCKATILHQSICMVQMILKDVATNHGNLGNSGASLIKEVTSNTYEIALPQGRHDAVITYEFDAKKDGTVTLISKKESQRNQ